MVEKLLAVVGNNDDEQPPRGILFPDPRDEVPDLGVDIGDLGVVEADDVVEILGREALDRSALSLEELGGRGGLEGAGVVPNRVVGEAGRRIKGPVTVVVMDQQEEGAPVVTVKPGEDSIEKVWTNRLAPGKPNPRPEPPE